MRRYFYRVTLLRSHKEQKTTTPVLVWKLYWTSKLHRHTCTVPNTTVLTHRALLRHQALLQPLATYHFCRPLWQSDNGPVLISVSGMKRPRSEKGYITGHLSQLVGWKRNSLLSDCSLSDAASPLDILGLWPKSSAGSYQNGSRTSLMFHTTNYTTH